MDMRIKPLEIKINYAWVKPKEIQNLRKEIGRAQASPAHSPTSTLGWTHGRADVAV